MEKELEQHQGGAAAPTTEELIDMAESGTDIREAGIDEAEMTSEPPAEDAQA